jgi:hypothetical protein
LAKVYYFFVIPNEQDGIEPAGAGYCKYLKLPTVWGMWLYDAYAETGRKEEGMHCQCLISGKKHTNKF